MWIFFSDFVCCFGSLYFFIHWKKVWIIFNCLFIRYIQLTIQSIKVCDKDDTLSVNWNERTLKTYSLMIKIVIGIQFQIVGIEIVLQFLFQLWHKITILLRIEGGASLMTRVPWPTLDLTVTLMSLKYKYIHPCILRTHHGLNARHCMHLHEWILQKLQTQTHPLQVNIPLCVS